MILKLNNIDIKKNSIQKYTIESADSLAEMCLQMNMSLGLNFGAYDFALKEDGSAVFLEVNPNGKWGFVENKTGLPLSQAMADLLLLRS